LVRLHQGHLTVASEPGQGSTFTFTVPVYSMARLLSPVITYQNALRPSLVLMEVDLKPRSNPPRGNWKETWQQSLETLRRCVYLDKDLVLPPIGSATTTETFFVVASTDMQHAGIMATRIREQLERLDDLTSKATVTITMNPIEVSPGASGEGLKDQIDRVAERVTGMVLQAMGRDRKAGAKIN
jgi:hypothetical protein